MNSYLEKILERKKDEALSLRPRKRFFDVFKKGKFGVIAEIKRKSPSKGALALIEDPIKKAEEYLEGGALALSILTDKKDFGGSLEDLHKISLHCLQVPLLRKDFLLSPLQLSQSLASGANAILLIVAALGMQLNDMLKRAEDLNLDALVEVHSEKEIEIALKAKARIIGVNNRDLSTFKVDLALAEKLSKYIPDDVLKIAESGIASIQDARRMKEAGFDAVLIGEMLVKSQNSSELIKEISSL